LLAVTVVAAIGISLFDSSYNMLQTATDAAGFRRALGSHNRAFAATGCDIVFAVGYGGLGLVALRALDPPRRLALAAAVVVVASSLFDELENLILMRNVTSAQTLTNGWITVMRVPGTLKWIGSPIFLVLLIATARRALRRIPDPDRAHR
jgi:hypothetical protein